MSITYGILAVAFAILGILDLMNDNVVMGVIVLIAAGIIGATAIVVAVYHKRYLPSTRSSLQRSKL